jgi:hypothetical protein
MVRCETIAVTKDQAKRLHSAAKVKRAMTRTKPKPKMGEYFKFLKGKVPAMTDSKTSCADHRLVRVACGLREKADITHKSRGNVRFKQGTALAKKHPMGVRCYAPPMTMAPAAYRMDLGDMRAVSDRANDALAAIQPRVVAAQAELDAHPHGARAQSTRLQSMHLIRKRKLADLQDAQRRSNLMANDVAHKTLGHLRKQNRVRRVMRFPVPPPVAYGPHPNPNHPNAF